MKCILVFSCYESIRPADNTPVDTSTNVLVVPFAPQTSVLHHYNVHVFLTHGGLNSICESLIAGTPLVLLPFMGDQLENAAKIDAIGAGIMIVCIFEQQYVHI